MPATAAGRRLPSRGSDARRRTTDLTDQHLPIRMNRSRTFTHLRQDQMTMQMYCCTDSRSARAKSACFPRLVGDRHVAALVARRSTAGQGEARTPDDPRVHVLAAAHLPPRATRVRIPYAPPNESFASAGFSPVRAAGQGFTAAHIRQFGALIGPDWPTRPRLGVSS